MSGAGTTPKCPSPPRPQEGLTPGHRRPACFTILPALMSRSHCRARERDRPLHSAGGR
jgi:hypothetical protein